MQSRAEGFERIFLCVTTSHLFSLWRSAPHRQCFAREPTLCYEYKTLGAKQDTQEKEAAKRPPKRRKWLRLLGFGFLGLVLLILVFHRPIFFEGTRYFVLRAAKQQQLDLSYEMRGTIFSTLSVSNLKATPIQNGPIQRLEISTLNLRYSLWDLLRDGLPAFLKELEIRDVFVELTPAEPLPSEKKREKQSFKFPALFPESLILNNINLVIHAPAGDTRLENFYFSLLPDQPGALEIETLDIPGVRRWTDIHASTSYRDRNLILTELVVDSGIKLRELNLDLSQLEKNHLALSLDGTFFDAPLRLNGQVTDLNEGNHLRLEAKIDALDFEPIWKYLNLSLPLTGKLQELTLSFEGEPQRPAAWRGSTRAHFENLKYNQQQLGQIKLEVNLADGQGALTLTEAFDEHNSLTVTGAIRLPPSLKEFPETKAEAQLSLSLPHTGELDLPTPVAGDLTVTGTLHMDDGTLKAELDLASQTLAIADAELTQTQLDIVLERDLSVPDDHPFFQSLSTTVQGTLQQARYQDYHAEALTLKSRSQNATVILEELTLAKNSNTARIQAQYQLPQDLQSWTEQTLSVALSVEAPQLADFLTPNDPTKLSGKLQLEGNLKLRNQLLNGNLSLKGRDISAHGIPIQTANIEAVVSDNRANFKTLGLVLNEKNRIEGAGHADWNETLSYGGSLNAELKDLSVFQPLLSNGPDRKALGGALTVYWKGQGDTGIPQHSGYANVDLSGGKFGDQENLAAHFKASYDAAHVSIPDFVISSDPGNATFSLWWKNDRLTITGLRVRRDDSNLLEGQLALPLHLAEWKDRSRLIPPNEPLTLKLKSRDLDFADWTQPSQDTPPTLQGLLNLDAELQGSLETLQGQVSLEARDLQSPAASQVNPATFSLKLTLKDKRLDVDGTLKQEWIEALRLSGSLPLDAAALVKTGKLDPETPLNLKLHLPRSSLAFLSTAFIPIRLSRGFAEIDVMAKGTLAKPVLDGSINAHLETLRFADPMLPPIADFNLKFDFDADQMSLSRCEGGIAGGRFSLGGGLRFTPLGNPILDLHFQSKDALLLQNDAMTVRASSDLKIEGPLNAAAVTGSVDITRSRFFKNIDILPIGLPGRPAPQPPEEFTAVSFPNPPLRDWTFDVAIRTADPFLVQGNLANGRITATLQLKGTGLAPWMEGKILIRRLTASLPFSQLRIAEGEIFFTRERPFMPQLNLDCSSDIRSYHVVISIAGPITDPYTFFSSEPPLTQAAIVSLIATGMTSQELKNNPNALAGRAALVVAQELFNRIFRRNQSPASHNDFLDQVQFDIGVADPKTGRQSARVGIPLSKRFMLTGGMSVGGDFQGQIKYLIRFK